MPEMRQNTENTFVKLRDDVMQYFAYACASLFTRLKKALKMEKDVGMACQKVCKQGRNGIIVKV